MSKKKILLVNLSRIWGGGEQWFFSVAKQLMGHGYEVCLWVRKESEIQKRAVEAGIEIIPVNLKFLSWLNPFRILKARSKLKRFHPDCILLNSSHELKTIGLLAYFLGLPNIIFRRGFPIHYLKTASIVGLLKMLLMDLLLILQQLIMPS